MQGHSRALGSRLRNSLDLCLPCCNFLGAYSEWRRHRRALELIRAGALKRASEGSKSGRGYARELAVVADQLLASGNPKHRFVIAGATLLGKDGQPVNEWDVVRIALDDSHAWSLTATECAVSRNAAKDGEAREKLEHLHQQVADRFTDLTTCRTLLATVKGGQLKYADAGRSWSRVGA